MQEQDQMDPGQPTQPLGDRSQLVAVATIRSSAIHFEVSDRESRAQWSAKVAEPEPCDKPGSDSRRLFQLQHRMAQRVMPYDLVRQALLLIGRLGDTFEEQDPERAVEALGLVLVHASIIALIEHLAIGPIIDLGIALRRTDTAEPLRAAAMVARAVMRGRTPESARSPDEDRMALVEALGMAIAKGMDDCEIAHEVEIRDPRELLERIAREVAIGELPRRRPASGLYDYAPRDNRPRPMDPERKAAALAQLQAAAEQLDAVEIGLVDIDGAGAPITEVELDGRRPHAQIVVPRPGLADIGQACEPAMRETIEERMAHARSFASEYLQAPASPSMAEVMERELQHAEQRAAADDEFMATVATDGFAAAITKHKAPVDPATITGLADSMPPPEVQRAGIVEVPPRHAMTMVASAAMAAWRSGPPPGVPETTGGPFWREGETPIVRGLVDDPDGRRSESDAELRERLKPQGPPPGVPYIAPATAEEKRLGVSAGTVCPQCAAPMTSDPRDDLYRCNNGHEHSGRYRAALGAPVMRNARQFPPPRPVTIERVTLTGEVDPPRKP